ncbi:MAG: glycosyltransferase [Aureliella sp.]
MTSTPRLTIGLPVFNGENYLESALSRLLDQTFEDFDLRISDNNSNDGTQSICERFAATDSRIRYERLEGNVGAIENFNRLSRGVQTEFFKWAAHDDICEANYLESCIDALDNDSGCVWSHSTSDLVDEDETSFLPMLPEEREDIHVDASGNRSWVGLPREDYRDSRPHRRFAGVLLGTRWCVDSYGVFRTSTLERSGLYPNVYGSEKVLIGDVSLRGKYAHIDQPLFKQRLHLDASSFRSDSREAQAEYCNAEPTKSILASTRLRLLNAHLSVVRRSQLSRMERLLCYRVVGAYLLQFRKWSRVLLGALKGTGISGDAQRNIKSATRREASHDCG